MALTFVRTTELLQDMGGDYRARLMLSDGDTRFVSFPTEPTDQEILDAAARVIASESQPVDRVTPLFEQLIVTYTQLAQVSPTMGAATKTQLETIQMLKQTQIGTG
jgi:hypothetical protein